MEAAPNPPTVPEVLQALVRLVSDLQRKNTTMIDYYIHPSPTPTEIAAYEPRILILRTRVQNLAELSLNHITMLIDDAVGLLASYTLPNVSQLAASSMGIQTIFTEHYDRRLEQSLPYRTIFESLRYYEHNLHQFAAMYFDSPRRQPAEAYIPSPSPVSPSLCRGAIAFLNNRDQGRISHVAEIDLLPQHRGRLADRGGVVLWWECPVCAFKLRYHASNSTALSINSTDEIMIEDDVTDIAYRSAWLAKCHIYHPRQPKPPALAPAPLPPPISPTSPTSPTFPKPKSKSKHQRPLPPPTTKRPSFTRRKSNPTPLITRTSSTRIITISPSPPPEPKHKPKSHSKNQPSPDLTGPQNLCYYCPFCIAKGKAMIGPPPPDSSSSDSNSEIKHPDPTCFEDSKELMEHIDDRHTRDRPVSLLLQRLKVAVDGKMAPGPEGSRVRWDLDLRC